MSKLTHIDADGNARMVDVGDKEVRARRAVARGSIDVGDHAWTALTSGHNKKGDVLAVAQLAGIQAAKRTADWIPLCHPLPLSGVDVSVSLDEDTRRVVARATVRTEWKTGVEMEALCAVSAALLTVYDMLKAVDKGMRIRAIELVEKSGGRSGPWTRDRASDS